MKIPLLSKAILPVLASVLMAGVSPAATVLIDFGPTLTTTDSLGRSWNNVTAGTQPTAAAPQSLLDTTNTASGASLSITSTSGTMRFADANQNGNNPSNGAALGRGYPTTATQDSLYGYNVNTGGAFTNPSGPVTLTLSGLTAGLTYNFFGFASRGTTLPDNREELLSFQGAGPAVNIVYQASNTAGNTFASGDVVANPGGQISLTVSPTANNNTPSQFFYLGVLEFSNVPEPGTMSLLGVGGVGALGIFLRRRK